MLTATLKGERIMTEETVVQIGDGKRITIGVKFFVVDEDEESKKALSEPRAKVAAMVRDVSDLISALPSDLGRRHDLSVALRTIIEGLDDYQRLSKQVDRLASFIVEKFPGEPSRSEGAVDTAIRIMSGGLRFGSGCAGMEA